MPSAVACTPEHIIVAMGKTIKAFTMDLQCFACVELPSSVSVSDLFYLPLSDAIVTVEKEHETAKDGALTESKARRGKEMTLQSAHALSHSLSLSLFLSLYQSIFLPVCLSIVPALYNSHLSAYLQFYFRPFLDLFISLLTLTTLPLTLERLAGLCVLQLAARSGRVTSSHLIYRRAQSCVPSQLHCTHTFAHARSHRCGADALCEACALCLHRF